ncbi:ATP-binding protein [Ramlibacter rhizophilus]|uniref:histidine kinase n=1 Tax=Ramlibacter rhizophilus TaxID=1781167 RepID=A0A4Z0BJM3_9BURK|nr:ATP-binding protein [Ramlibacter rhizophilus]TFY99515.1 PAS domain S-box protein [Ramlibacter rhizophilus]
MKRLTRLRLSARITRLRTVAALSGGLALLLVAVWSLTLERVVYEAREAEEAEVTQVGRLSLAYEQQVRQLLAGPTAALRLLTADPASWRDLLAQTRPVPPAFAAAGLPVSLADATGTPVGAAPALPPDWAQGLIALHQQHPQAAALIQQPIMDAQGRWVTTLSRGLWDQGRLQGVAYTPVDPGALLAFFALGGLAPQDTVTLFDPSGIVLARRSGAGQDRFGLDVGQSALAKAAAQGLRRTLFTTSPVDGIERAYSLRPLPEHGLTVAVGLGRAQAMAPVRDRAQRYLVLASLLTVLGVVAVVGLGAAWLRHQRSVARLRRSERHYRALTQLSADWFWETDAQHRFTHQTAAPRHAGAQVPVHFGLTRWEQPGVLGSAEDWTRHREDLDRHRAFFDFEVRRIDAAGRLRVALISGMPVFDAEQRFLGYRGIGHEITAQHEAREALRESEEGYRLVFENTRDGLMIGRSFGQVDQVNPAACQLLGRSEAELLQLGLSVLDGPDSPLRQVLEEARRTGHAQATFTVRRPDGLQAHLQASFAHYLDSGDRRRSSVLLHDLTERHQAQRSQAELAEQLRQSQKMEALGSIAGGIAHDFNNVIAAIMGNARLATSALAGSGPAARYLDEIARAGLRARELVRRILTFTRQQPAVFERQPLGPVVREAVDLLRATLPSGVRITLQGDEEPFEVMADANQIHQVVMNLGTNAWQAMSGRGGRIDIRLAAPPGSGWVVLSVQDDGAGMDAGTQARMFEPFFTTKREGEGTGLGLAVVQNIVRAHFGEIAVDSRPGQGTRMEVRLPVACEAENTGFAPLPAREVPVAETQPVPLPSGAGGGRHIVYVDDYEAMVVMVSAVLQAQGFRVAGFHRSLEALAYVRRQGSAVDLLITDYNMPDLSGLDLARELRALRPQLPIIVASGHVTDTLREGALSAGVSCLFDKPAGIDALCRRVHEQLAQDDPLTGF